LLRYFESVAKDLELTEAERIVFEDLFLASAALQRQARR